MCTSCDRIDRIVARLVIMIETGQGLFERRLLETAIELLKAEQRAIPCERKTNQSL